MILFFVAKTILEYYNILWVNPLIDHKSIVEVAFRKNSIQVIVALIAILSGILLIKNLSKGWIMSIITWIMFTILLTISTYRIYQRNPAELDLVSRVFISFLVIVFITITGMLNSAELRQKYKPTRSSWITIAITITALTSAKFVYT
ncbi:hypothetical protein [Flavobacterium algoritolerans]|nr:hypothetical protein [Flavobacterium algoritolerans]